jgi:DNA-binding FadR family transcriptional regulator
VVQAAATVFLDQRGISASDLIAIRGDLESDALAAAAERASSLDIARLRDTLAADAQAGFENPSGEELHVRIAEIAGNPATALFVRVLLELTRARAAIPGRRSRMRTAINSETDHAHQAIVDALANRDPALARRRLLKHFQAMEPLLR